MAVESGAVCEGIQVALEFRMIDPTDQDLEPFPLNPPEEEGRGESAKLRLDPMEKVFAGFLVALAVFAMGMAVWDFSGL